MLDRTTLLPGPAAKMQPPVRTNRTSWRTILPQRTSALARAAFVVAATIADGFAIIATALVADMGYHSTLNDPSSFDDAFLRLALVISVLFIVPNLYREDYAISRYLTVRPGLARSFASWNIAFLGTLGFGFMTKTTAAYSRGSILLFYSIGFLAVILVRVLIARIVRRRTASLGALAARRVFLVGREATIEAFQRLYEPWNFGLHIVAAAVLRSEPGHLDEDLKLAAASARILRPDDVFVLEPWSGHDTIEACLDAFMRVPASIHLGPERLLDRFVDAHISKIGPLASLEVVRRPLTATEITVKRLFDIVVTCAALVLLSPLLLVCALAIKLDSRGPVFFMQRRYGFNQEPFRIFKFRSMTTARDAGAFVQTVRNDGRVTRVGRLIRRWNIDELPQLLNVLKGDMSLVGPRPHALAHDQQFEQKIALYARRHNVRPGITGWAQVNGLRGETDTEDKMRLRVEHDLYYIDNWSLWLDLKILALTVVSPRAYRNAL